MKDILPDQSFYWDRLEQLLRSISIRYGYQEIRLPLVEFTQLFARSIGEATDIVEKEMYTFADRNGDSLTLRPEGTAGTIRAGIEHGLFYNQIQRLFYLGPMFRHERPQKGRYRQFHQFGVEAYGLAGPDIDIEMMQLANSFWEELKIADQDELQINTLGSAEDRASYREKLVEYFDRNRTALDEDSKRRLVSNPLRILDSKNPDMQELIQDAPKITEHLNKEARHHFDVLCNTLEKINLPYVVNPCLVRGLDYYCLTVFEWVTKENIAQNTVCAGGHYDGLVEAMGGKSTPAIGFALGLERLLSLVADNLSLSNLPLIYFIMLGEKAMPEGMRLADIVRKNTNYQVVTSCGNNLGSQLKRADKNKANIACILGDTELDNGEVLVKYLRDNKPQVSVSNDTIIDFLQNN